MGVCMIEERGSRRRSRTGSRRSETKPIPPLAVGAPRRRVNGANEAKGGHPGPRSRANEANVAAYVGSELRERSQLKSSRGLNSRERSQCGRQTARRSRSDGASLQAWRIDLSTRVDRRDHHEARLDPRFRRGERRATGRIADRSGGVEPGDLPGTRAVISTRRDPAICRPASVSPAGPPSCPAAGVRLAGCRGEPRRMVR